MGTAISLHVLRHAVTTAMNAAPGMSHLALTYLTGHVTRDILAEYVALDPVAEMQHYFDTMGPLLDAIIERSRILGILTA
jgi:hypothetical protein